MNTNDLAARLNTTPKSLRRTLRKHFAFMRPDSGPWTFTEADYRYIKDALTPEPQESDLVEDHTLTTSPAADAASLTNYWSDPKVRADHKLLYASRRAKLLNRLYDLQNT